MSTSLAERLKSETRALHTEAERSAFMGVLLRGEMERAPYCALLRNLHAIYAALEPALQRHRGHPVIAPIFAPGLARTQSIASDLGVLHGPDWAVALELQPAAARYVQRLRQIDSDAPELLLAHAYVRYLGDLSGGQVLRGIVARSLRLGPERGTTFYDFGDADETLRSTQAFRAGLDAVALADCDISAIVAEARSAFERHRVLFEELAAASGTEQMNLAEERGGAPR